MSPCVCCRPYEFGRRKPTVLAKRIGKQIVGTCDCHNRVSEKTMSFHDSHRDSRRAITLILISVQAFANKHQQLANTDYPTVANQWLRGIMKPGLFMFRSV